MLFRSVRNAVVSPKDPLDIDDQCGVVYISQCDLCGEQYVGETGRSLGERCDEHDKSVEKGDSKSALSQHQERTGHKVNSLASTKDKIKILEREPRDTHRKIKEAIHIKLKQASLNRHEGYTLPDLYMPLLREEAGEGEPRH